MKRNRKMHVRNMVEKGVVLSCALTKELATTRMRQCRVGHYFNSMPHCLCLNIGLMRRILRCFKQIIQPFSFGFSHCFDPFSFAYQVCIENTKSKCVIFSTLRLFFQLNLLEKFNIKLVTR